MLNKNIYTFHISESCISATASSPITPCTPLLVCLVSSCEHLSMILALIFYGPLVSHHLLAAMLHNMSAFFPCSWLKRRKICSNTMQSGKLSSVASLSYYRLEACCEAREPAGMGSQLSCMNSGLSARP